MLVIRFSDLCFDFEDSTYAMVSIFMQLKLPFIFATFIPDKQRLDTWYENAYDYTSLPSSRISLPHILFLEYFYFIGEDFFSLIPKIFLRFKTLKFLEC